MMYEQTIFFIIGVYFPPLGLSPHLAKQYTRLGVSPPTFGILPPRLGVLPPMLAPTTQA
jgi:hypothetical protein